MQPAPVVEPSPVQQPMPEASMPAPEPVIEAQQEQNLAPSKKDVMEAVESIKQKISENVEKGYKIVVEDFDFKRSYQMIVKIEKE